MCIFNQALGAGHCLRINSKPPSLAGRWLLKIISNGQQTLIGLIVYPFNGAA